MMESIVKDVILRHWVNNNGIMQGWNRWMREKVKNVGNEACRMFISGWVSKKGIQHAS